MRKLHGRQHVFIIVELNICPSDTRARTFYRLEFPADRPELPMAYLAATGARVKTPRPGGRGGQALQILVSAWRH
jgi:hypothetical protein